jgi:hypothetical protein
VITGYRARFITASLLIVLTCSTALAWTRKKGQKAQVKFLATSTLIRGTWGPNEDTYLAELLTARGDESYLIRLVDAYPNEAPPLPLAALTSDKETCLRIQRDPECDKPYEQMLLRSAPGDPITIVLDRFEYRPQLSWILQSSSKLPCFRTVRLIPLEVLAVICGDIHNVDLRS